MHEHHDGQRFAAGILGGDDVECQAVLAPRLKLAGPDDGVAALLRSAFGERMAVPHTRPRLDRLRRPESQRPDRRAGVRNGTPPVHAVAGETLDGAGGGVCADGVFVHIATVANDAAR